MFQQWKGGRCLIIITGYRIKEANLNQLTSLLDTVQDNINRKATRAYHKLIGDEIAFLCDNIALNILNRPTNESIYNIAVQNVDKKIQTAALTNLDCKYNFQVYAHLMSPGESAPKEVDSDYTYVQVNCLNQELLSAFKGFEEYSLDYSEFKNNESKKTLCWAALHRMYDGKTVPAVNLTPLLIPDSYKIKYPDFRERKRRMARYSMMNSFLSKCSGGEQIPPYALMREVDDSFAMLLTEDSKREMGEEEAHLDSILIKLPENDKIVFEENTEFVSDS